MVLGKVLREGKDDFVENLRRFEMAQMEMGLRLREYGIRVDDQSQFPHGHSPAEKADSLSKEPFKDARHKGFDPKLKRPI